MPHIPALEYSRQMSAQRSGERVCPGLQDSKTETTGNGDLLFALHVEIPDNEPWENRKGKVGGDKPC